METVTLLLIVFTVSVHSYVLQPSEFVTPPPELSLHCCHTVYGRSVVTTIILLGNI